MITVQFSKLNFKLDSPISISFHTWYFSENVLVKLVYKDYVGLGEAAPFKPITGDSQEELLKELKTLTDLPLDPTQDSVQQLHEYCDKNNISYTLRAALDFAYHDLVAKIKGIPVYRMYTAQPKLVQNSVTVFIKDTIEETAAEAKKLFDKYQDLRVLKIKLKGDADIERVKAIKSVAPAKMQFTLDANQGFQDPKDAVEVLTDIGTILEDVLLVEEPCPRGELDKLRYVTENMKSMMVFADESAATVSDAEKVISEKAAHGINIKLQKAGGIWPGKVIASMCEKVGYKIMLGCMLEGPVSIMAGIHYVVSTPDVILADLDMDLDMPYHATGAAPLKEGVRAPSDAPGLGVAFDEAAMKQLEADGLLVRT